jgi:predicted metal-dependent phosphoesterase TrpH
MENEIDSVALNQELAKFGKDDEIRITIQSYDDSNNRYFDRLFICYGPKEAEATITTHVNHSVDGWYGIDYQID